MKRKLIACFTILVLTISGLVAMPATAAPAQSEEGKIRLISGLNIMTGDPDGNFRLEDTITRAEFTKVAIAASDYRNAVAAGLAVSPYADVSYQHWAAPYIKLAASNKLVNGYVDSTFRPDNNISFEEAVTIALKLLGYTNEDFGSSWPYGQIGLAGNLKLTDGVACSLGEAMTRRDVVNLLYNLLDTEKKGSRDKYITTFDCTITENVVIIATNSEDSSINAHKVYTSAGTFEIDDRFDRSCVGRTGDLIVQNTDEVLYFSPYEQIVTEYGVDAVVGADLILDGKMPDLDDNFTVYNKSQKSTYQNIVSITNAGSRFVTYADSNGSLEYAFLYDNDIKSADVKDLEKYVVYSKLNNAIIAYQNGTITQIPVTDATDAYRDNQRSTYGSLKAGLELGDVVYVKRDGKNNVDYISVEDGNVEGPVTVSAADWSASFGDLSAMTVMRDGKKVAADELQVNDIAYHSADLNMIFAYSDKITGIYDSAAPNKDLPESVTVSGTVYQLESVEAFNKLSSNGSFSYGDTVTLLLGKNGAVADVIAPGSIDQTVHGYLTATGKKDYTNSTGESYSGYYISVVQADGKNYEYRAKSDYSSAVNSVVRVTFRDGLATASRQGGNQSISGTVNAAGEKLGSNPVASNVQILDVSTTRSDEPGSYTSTYLQRLDGISISSSDILYYERDSQNRINKLILNNITGDAAHYGIVTSAKSNVSDRSLSGSYTVDIGGSSYSLNSNNAVYQVGRGQAVKVTLNGNSISGLQRIEEVSGSITGVTQTAVVTGSKVSYPLASNVAVYRRTADYQYMLIPLSDIIGNDNVTLTAYIDKSPSSGGRVRVIVAADKLN